MDRVAKPVQTGDVIDYLNAGSEVIKVGDVVEMKNMCGIAETDIEPGEKGAVALVGVWEVPAVTGAFEVGELVYWNKTKATKTSTDNPPLGFVVAPKLANGTVTRVKLLPFAAPEPTTP